MPLDIPQTNTLQSTTLTSALPSPTQTVIDLNGTISPKKATPASSLASPPTLDEKSTKATEDQPAQPKLSQRKKWSLLAVFSMGLFIDIWSYSAFFIFTDPISEEYGVPLAQQSWVITAYAVTFSAFLLFWGRVSDLYSAKPVFAYGFLSLGILDVIISFLPDKYSFFVLRAISGISGAALIPAAYRLIPSVFEPHELGKAFTLFGMSGALANVTGIVIAGLIEYIPTSGQGAPFRWFFRILGILIIPVSIGSLFWIPKPQGAIASVESKWKRLDLVGSLSMLAGIVLLILGLTLGAAEGWKTAGFLAPFLLSWVLFVFFFIWEAKLPEEYALLPAKTWKIPNFTILMVFALYVYSWWATNFLPFVETFLKVYDEKPIIAAVRLLPEGIAAGAATILLTIFPKLVSRPRWPITAGMLAALTGLAMFTQWTGDQLGPKYWSLVFLGGIIGSAGMMTVFTGVNVGIMTSVPAEMSGVAGAVLQVSFQVGSAVALSIQAGLFTVNEGWIYNFKNVQASWYFQLGWGIVWLILFLIFYRPGKKAVSSDVDGAEQGERVIVAH